MITVAPTVVAIAAIVAGIAAADTLYWDPQAAMLLALVSVWVPSSMLTMLWLGGVVRRGSQVRDGRWTRTEPGTSRIRAGHRVPAPLAPGAGDRHVPATTSTIVQASPSLTGS